MIIASNYKLLNLANIPFIHIDNNPLQRVEYSKSLGVFIDEKLAWTKHIDHMSKKISSAIGGLRRCTSFCSRGYPKNIYNALIQPLFDYCDVVWGNINKGLTDRLQKLQNRAARVIASANYEIRSETILRQLQWDNLSQRRFKHQAVEMFKITHGKAPRYLQEQFRASTIS